MMLLNGSVIYIIVKIGIAFVIMTLVGVSIGATIGYQTQYQQHNQMVLLVCRLSGY